MDVKTLQNIPPWDWPEDAAERFLELLRNLHADFRVRRLRGCSRAAPRKV
jgi:hypothetical protein